MSDVVGRGDAAFRTFCSAFRDHRRMVSKCYSNLAVTSLRQHDANRIRSGYEPGTTSTSDDTRRTPRTASATSTDSTLASSDLVLPESNTTPLLTDATPMPLSWTRRFALNAASTLSLIASSERFTTERIEFGTT